ncbi:MAG TPA: RICIN domain-containing protein, partial [Nitrospira sp.]|nr:RICIN domain-containing protein [Nitrospira sp.]
MSRTKETNLYAFASRDKAGKSYVNVMWVPGALAGSVPSIAINFVTDGSEKEGIKIHAKQEEHLAMGSGRNFAITCHKRCDEGFQVTVNGTLKNSAGAPTSSFTATVEIPPKASLIKASHVATTLSGKGVIVNVHSNLCLTVAGGGTANNTTAVQYLCDNDPSRSWNLTPAEGANTL